MWDDCFALRPRVAQAALVRCGAFIRRTAVTVTHTCIVLLVEALIICKGRPKAMQERSHHTSCADTNVSPAFAMLREVAAKYASGAGVRIGKSSTEKHIGPTAYRNVHADSAQSAAKLGQVQDPCARPHNESHYLWVTNMPIQLHTSLDCLLELQQQHGVPRDRQGACCAGMLHCERENPAQDHGTSRQHPEQRPYQQLASGTELRSFYGLLDVGQP